MGTPDHPSHQRTPLHLSHVIRISLCTPSSSLSLLFSCTFVTCFVFVSFRVHFTAAGIRGFFTTSYLVTCGLPTREPNRVDRAQNSSSMKRSRSKRRRRRRRRACDIGKHFASQKEDGKHGSLYGH